MKRTALVGCFALSALSVLDGCSTSPLTPAGAGGGGGGAVAGTAGTGGTGGGAVTGTAGDGQDVVQPPNDAAVVPACDGPVPRLLAALRRVPTPPADQTTIPPPVDLAGTVSGVSLDGSGTVQIAIRDQNSADWVLSTPSPAAVDWWGASAQEIVGREVTLKARYARRFQMDVSFGFVLSDADGLVMAAETGPWQNTLNADTPLPIRHGASLCVADPCGATITELIFSGTTDVTVGLSGDGQLTIGGRQYLAHNSGALRLPALYSCNEGDAATEKWAVWRQPLP
jgi:hypothetical protein